MLLYSYCHGNCVVLPHFMGKWLTSASKKLMVYTHPWLYVYIAVWGMMQCPSRVTMYLHSSSQRLNETWGGRGNNMIPRLQTLTAKATMGVWPAKHEQNRTSYLSSSSKESTNWRIFLQGNNTFTVHLSPVELQYCSFGRLISTWSLVPWPSLLFFFSWCSQ